MYFKVSQSTFEQHFEPHLPQPIMVTGFDSDIVAGLYKSTWLDARCAPPDMLVHKTATADFIVFRYHNHHGYKEFSLPIQYDPADLKLIKRSTPMMHGVYLTPSLYAEHAVAVYLIDLHLTAITGAGPFTVDMTPEMRHAAHLQFYNAAITAPMVFKSVLDKLGNGSTDYLSMQQRAGTLAPIGELHTWRDHMVQA